MKMLSHEKILEILFTERLTYHEIAEKTGLSYDGVRGRISELRSMGYVIEKDGEKFYLEIPKPLIPFKIRTIGNPDGSTNIKVTIPLHYATYDETKKLDDIENNFFVLVKNCKKLIEKIENNKDKKMDVLLNWEIGDLIQKFKSNYIDVGFYCSNLDKTLEKYIKNHRREFWRIRRLFRQQYPTKEKLNPIGFNAYNEIIVVGDSKIRKQLEDYVLLNMEQGNAISARMIRDKRWELGGTRKGSSKKRSMESNL